MKQICYVCGNIFETRTANQKFCSAECFKQYCEWKGINGGDDKMTKTQKLKEDFKPIEKFGDVLEINSQGFVRNRDTGKLIHLRFNIGKTSYSAYKAFEEAFGYPIVNAEFNRAQKAISVSIEKGDFKKTFKSLSDAMLEMPYDMLSGSAMRSIFSLKLKEYEGFKFEYGAAYDEKDL